MNVRSYPTYVTHIRYDRNGMIYDDLFDKIICRRDGPHYCCELKNGDSCDPMLISRTFTTGRALILSLNCTLLYTVALRILYKVPLPIYSLSLKPLWLLHESAKERAATPKILLHTSVSSIQIYPHYLVIT